MAACMFKQSVHDHIRTHPRLREVVLQFPEREEVQ